MCDNTKPIPNVQKVETPVANVPSLRIMSLMSEYAEYLGVQESVNGDVFLWNVVRPLHGLTVGSTVTRESLIAAIDRLHGVEPSQTEKLAEFSSLTDAVESPAVGIVQCVPDRPPTFVFEREDGSSLDVFAYLSRGEPGSLSVPDSVQIASITDYLGNEVDPTAEEMAAIRASAEKYLL